MPKPSRFEIKTQITIQDSDNNLSRYFSEIRNHQPLTKEEENDLIKRIQQHDDPAALTKLINANLRFVVSVAKKYQGQGAQLLDLISEGNAGMIEAARRFDPNEDIKFFSYAIWWIRQKMFTSISMHKRIIRLPDNRWLLADRIKKEIASLEQQLNRYPSIDELCDHLKHEYQPNEIKEAIVHAGRMPSLEDRIGDQMECEDTLGDTIPDTSMEIDGSDKFNSVTSDLNRFLFNLSQWEYDVLVLSLGLNGEESKRTQDIAKLLKLKLKEVVKLKPRAIKRLKKLKNIGSLKEYL